MNTENYPVIELPEGFSDDRGVIQPLVDGGFAAVQVITSKKDTVRANHYHKKDSHYMYIVSGVMRYFHRPVGETGVPDYVDLKAGQLVHTPAMVEHAALFLEDCTFLNITSEKRDQATYEDDIVRVNLYPGT